MDPHKITALLRGKVFYKLNVDDVGRVCVVFSDDSQLTVDTRVSGVPALSFSTVHGDESVPSAQFSVGQHGELDQGAVEWIEAPSADTIRAAVLTTRMEYGAEFRLRHPSGALLIAASLHGPVLEPEEPGKFEMVENDRNLGSGFTRIEVMQRFLATLESVLSERGS